MTTDKEVQALRAKVEQLQASVTALEGKRKGNRKLQKGRTHRRTVRYQTSATLLGLPLISVAIGPDEQNAEVRGYAKGIFAFGDIASGVFALGGISCGIIAIGGIAVGLIAVGGVAIGVMAGVGGVASGYFAVGGVAIGVETIGGAQVSLSTARG